MNRVAAAWGGIHIAALTVALVALAGCASTGFDSYISPLPSKPTGKVTAAPVGPAGAARTRQSAPKVAMAGRWTLASDTGACGMNFGGALNTAEGTIAPEGGCPGRFYTSRKWTLERDGLVIRDHQGKPLAQLAMSSPVRFQGQAADGMYLTLSR